LLALATGWAISDSQIFIFVTGVWILRAGFVVTKMCRSLIAGQPMKTLGKRVISPLSLALCVAILGGCSSPPPPPAVTPPPPVRTCQAMDKTDVLGDVRAENGEVTRVTTTTRCVTQ
jgi:hypothetical protein